MPTVTVSLPPSLTAPEPAAEVVCEASTVAEALRAVVAQAPRYAQRIFYKERPLVSVVLDGRHLPPSEALDTEITAGARLELLTPVAGG